MNPFFRNVEFIKANAKSYLNSLGYTLLGYEGADACPIFGGYVWFQAIRLDKPELVFTIQLRRQGDSLKWTLERIINPEAAGVSVTKNIEE